MQYDYVAGWLSSVDDHCFDMPVPLRVVSAVGRAEADYLRQMWVYLVGIEKGWKP